MALIIKMAVSEMTTPIGELTQHPSFLLAHDLSALCEPLYKYLKINYVDYAKYYPGGRVVPVFSDRGYFQSFAKDFTTSITPNNLIKSGMHLWSEYIPPAFLQQTSQQFHHDHGITLITEFNDYTEVMNFATYPENVAILNFYLNQQTLLQQIQHYIRCQTKKMVAKLEDNPLIIPGGVIRQEKNDLLYDELSNFLKSSQNVSININNISIPLTRREAQCLHYLHQGKTSKEIGRVLSISPRTIEIYLDQIRLKTASKTRLELISKIHKSQLEKLGTTL